MREMVDSGVAWIGQMPKGWHLFKMKYIGQFINGYPFKPEDWGDIGKPIIRIQDLTGSNKEPNYYSGSIDDKYSVSNGDILVSWAATLDAFEWNKGEGWLNQHIFKAIPDPSVVDRSYCVWILKTAMSHMNDDNKHGIMMQHVTLPVFNNFLVPLPDIEEQRTIASKLREDVRKTDALIILQENQIEKMKQYKQSLIMEVVTKGLNGNVTFKDCQVEWLSRIPSHWKECRIKDVIVPHEKPVLPEDDIITCFRDGEVTLRKNRRVEGYTLSDTEHGYQGVDIGDLVIHGMDAFAGAIGCSDSRGKTTPVVHVCSTKGNNRFFMYYLRCMAYGNILMDLSNGVRQRSSDYRNFARLGVFKIIVPPLEEQNEIVDYLDRKCEQIESIIKLKQAKLERLQAYRQALVYEYVTGKKEVM